ncbi:MAG: nucleoside kinase [Firmicutes bacterium]|nr:nucleoside kinase [Bacillota bacterium]
MKLTVDGSPVEIQTGQSLLDLARQLGLISGSLATDPLVAKIAGEIFTLNYVPQRQKELQPDRPDVRRAMAASGGVVRLLRYRDAEAHEAYVRTAQFVLFLALRQLWPHARARMNCTIGAGLYIQVSGAEDFSPRALKERVSALVAQDIPLIRKMGTTVGAIEYYASHGQDDKARLLRLRTAPQFPYYSYGDFRDFYYGEMMPSTGFLRVWDILPVDGGFMFIFPDDDDPDQVADYREMPKLFQVYREGEHWGGHMVECETVADLNDLTDSGKIRELIRVNEALHEKRFAQIADIICQRGAKAVMLAGPSSSGKTTSANRLSIQLRVQGKKPTLISLDDYYLDRDKIAPGPDGKIDLEHINTIDTALFAEHLAVLLAGGEVEMPTFSFKRGRREWVGRRMRLSDDSVLVVEGLHALNPVLLPDALDRSKVFRLYVSPLLPLNLDDHNRIPTSTLRLLRRIVRDYESRGSSVQHTLSMWDSVRAGEKRWIFPYQEKADVIFNSSTLYELAVLKKHVYPLLTAIGPEEECYEDVRSVVRMLQYVHEADVDNEIPPTSLVREFIGGNTFYL